MATTESAAAPTPARPGPAHARRRPRRRTPGRPVPVAVLALAGAVVAGLIGVVASFGRPFTFFGDEAVLGLRVIDANHFTAALGPYSRFGWNHPGPSLFYLAAPVYTAFGHSQRSLLLAALLLNGACLVAVVGVVRRFAGEWSARCSAALLAAVLLSLGIDYVGTWWNPSLEGAAVLLAMVLAAGAVAGSGLAVVGVAVVTTYVAQTDVGAAPTMVGVALIAGVGWGVHALVRAAAHRRAATERAPGPGLPAHGPLSPAGQNGHPLATPPGLNGRPLVSEIRSRLHLDHHRRVVRWVVGGVGVAVVVAAWVPPVVQQVTGHPGNLWAIWHFFTTPTTKYGRSHPLAQAWAVEANATTALPWGAVSPFARITWAPAHREVTVMVMAALGLASVVWGGVRRRWFALGLGLTTLAGLGLALWSAFRIVGPVQPYLVLWMALVPLPGALGVVTLAVGEVEAWTGRRAGERARYEFGAPGTGADVEQSGAWWTRWRAIGAVVLTAALLAPVVALAVAWAPGSHEVRSNGDPEVAQLTAFATAHLRGDVSGRVVVDIGNADRWPVTAGLVFQLTRLGYHPTVASDWAFVFGSGQVTPPGSTGLPHLVVSDPVPGLPPGGLADTSTFADGDLPTTITYLPAGALSP